MAGARGGLAVAQTRNAQEQGEQGEELHVALQADEEARISAWANWTYSGYKKLIGNLLLDDIV